MSDAAPTQSTDKNADIIAGEEVAGPEDGIALCLSGGGYRAMLFHAGTLTRLNELSVLPKLSRVSSVSGGSITAGILGVNWKHLDFDIDGRATNLNDQLIKPVQQIARKTIDRGSVLSGVLLPGSVSERIASFYDDVLFKQATLQDLPTDSEGPRLIFNATSVQSGALVRMSRPYLADHRVGVIRNPQILISEAVAASSAFPPVLSPAEIEVEPSDFEQDDRCDLQYEPYTSTLILADGGVYDNLGLETAWKRYKTVLVSDAGGKIEADPDPPANWAQHSKRILDIIDNQVRSLRKRHLINSFVSGERNGAYWGIRTNISDYQLADALPAPLKDTKRLADTPTRLKRLSLKRQQQLMNWGYVVCDAAIRSNASTLIGPNSPNPELPFGSAGLS